MINESIPIILNKLTIANHDKTRCMREVLLRWDKQTM